PALGEGAKSVAVIGFANRTSCAGQAANDRFWRSADGRLGAPPVERGLSRHAAVDARAHAEDLNGAAPGLATMVRLGSEPKTPVALFRRSSPAATSWESQPER